MEHRRFCTNSELPARAKTSDTVQLALVMFGIECHLAVRIALRNPLALIQVDIATKPESHGPRKERMALDLREQRSNNPESIRYTWSSTI